MPSALDHEVISIGLIRRMLERGTEQTTIQPALPGTVITGRFARDDDHFAVNTQRSAWGVVGARLVAEVVRSARRT